MQPRRHGWYRTLVVRLLAALVVVAAVASATGPGDTNNNDHRALLSTSFTAAQIRAMLTESVVSGRASGSTSGSGNASGSGSGRADASGSGIATGAMVDETPEDAREPPAKRTRWSARLRGRSSTGDDVATPSSAEARPYNAKPFSFVPPSQLSPQPQRQPLRLSTIASDLHGNFFQRLSLRERYRFACLTTRAIRESPPFVAYCTAMEEARALCGNDRFEELFLGMKSDLETLMLTELRLTSNADGVHLSSSRSALPRGCLGAVHRTGARWAHIRQRMPTMELHLPVASDEEREEIAEFLWSGGAGVRAMLVYVHAHSAGDNEEEEGEGGPIGLQTDVEKRMEEGIEAVMRSVVDGGTVERVRIVNWPNWRLLLAAIKGLTLASSPVRELTLGSDLGYSGSHVLLHPDDHEWGVIRRPMSPPIFIALARATNLHTLRFTMANRDSVDFFMQGYRQLQPGTSNLRTVSIVDGTAHAMNLASLESVRSFTVHALGFMFADTGDSHCRVLADALSRRSLNSLEELVVLRPLRDCTDELLLRLGEQRESLRSVVLMWEGITVRQVEVLVATLPHLEVVAIPSADITRDAFLAAVRRSLGSGADCAYAHAPTSSADMFVCQKKWNHALNLFDYGINVDAFSMSKLNHYVETCLAWQPGITAMARTMSALTEQQQEEREIAAHDGIPSQEAAANSLIDTTDVTLTNPTMILDSDDERQDPARLAADPAFQQTDNMGVRLCMRYARARVTCGEGLFTAYYLAQKRRWNMLEFPSILSTTCLAGMMADGDLLGHLSKAFYEPGEEEHNLQRESLIIRMLSNEWVGLHKLDIGRDHVEPHADMRLAAFLEDIARYPSSVTDLRFHRAPHVEVLAFGFADILQQEWSTIRSLTTYGAVDDELVELLASLSRLHTLSLVVSSEEQGRILADGISASHKANPSYGIRAVAALVDTDLSASNLFTIPVPNLSYRFENDIIDGLEIIHALKERPPRSLRTLSIVAFEVTEFVKNLAYALTPQRKSLRVLHLHFPIALEEVQYLEQLIATLVLRELSVEVEASVRVHERIRRWMEASRGAQGKTVRCRERSADNSPVLFVCTVME